MESVLCAGIQLPHNVVAAGGCANLAQEKPMGWGLVRCGALALSIALAAALAMPAHAQSPEAETTGPVSTQLSPQLFATLCALYASGLEAEPSTLDADPAFVNLLAQLRQLKGPATENLRQYYRDHVLAGSGETLSRYVTFALVAGPPPTFAITLGREDLPPDVLLLDGFSEVLANFYQEAKIEQRWREMQPVYERLATPV